MRIALESIASYVCGVINSLGEPKDLTAYGSMKAEELLGAVDKVHILFIEARNNIGELLNILCSEAENDSRFLPYKRTCISNYATVISRMMKPISIGQHLRDMIDRLAVEKSIARLFASMLCLESRRRSLFARYFNESDSMDASVDAAPLSIKKHLKVAITSVNSFDALSRIYCIFREFSVYPQKELDSVDNILVFSSVLERLYISTDPNSPVNKLGLQFLDIKVFCRDKLMATAYEYANREVLMYRMKPRDVLLFVMDSTNSTDDKSKTSVFLGQLSSNLSHGDAPMPQITYDPETYSGEIVKLDITHLTEPKPGKRVTFGQGLNYPTVQHVVYLLRKMCDCIEEEARGKFGEHIIDLYSSSLMYPSGIIYKNEVRASIL